MFGHNLILSSNTSRLPDTVPSDAKSEISSDLSFCNLNQDGGVTSTLSDPNVFVEINLVLWGLAREWVIGNVSSAHSFCNSKGLGQCNGQGTVSHPNCREHFASFREDHHPPSTRCQLSGPQIDHQLVGEKCNANKEVRIEWNKKGKKRKAEQMNESPFDAVSSEG